MINSLQIHKTNHAILSNFIASIYFSDGENTIKKYTVYPSTNCNLSLFKNADLEFINDELTINKSFTNNFKSILAKRTDTPLMINYNTIPEYEIAINFKPCGVCCFSNFTFSKQSNFYDFNCFNSELPILFNNVLSTQNTNEKLIYVEEFLLSHYKPVPNLKALLNLVILLNDLDNNMPLPKLINEIGINQKQLNRFFNNYIGCSVAHFKKIIRFRNSIVYFKLNAPEINLVELAHKFDYADQSHFIKQYRQLAKDRPKHFLQNLKSLADNQIFWKVMPDV